MLINNLKGVNMNNIVDSLMLSSLKHNYKKFVKEYGYVEADRKLHNLFGEAWLNNRKNVWQWFDVDYAGSNK